MQLNQNSVKLIKESQAIELTHAFQSKNPKSNIAYFIDSDIIKKNTDQENFIGILIYNGLASKTEEYNRVLVGVNSEQEDVVEGVLLDVLLPCPDYCPKKSSLMK